MHGRDGACVSGCLTLLVRRADALIGQEDTKRLCGNPTVKDETRFQVGCRT